MHLHRLTPRRRLLVALLAVLGLTGVSGATAVAAAGPGTTGDPLMAAKMAKVMRTYAAPDDRYNTGPVVRSDGHLESGAVIRIPALSTGVGPYIHANPSHINRGVEGVRISAGGDLLIDHYSAPIVTMHCDADETLAGERGIIVGLSRGSGLTEARFFDTRLGRNLDLRKAADYTRIASSTSNIWCSWLQVDPLADAVQVRG